MSHSDIYADVAKFSAPAKAPQYWRRVVELHDDVRLPLNDDQAVLIALKRKHSLKDLLASGVVVRDAQRRPQITDVLRNAVPPIVVLKDAPSGKPVDLMTDQGTMSGRLAMHACAGDYMVRDRVRQLNLLLLTFSMNDMVALRGVGLPAAPATGLCNLSSETLQQFRTLVPLQPHRLIFVGWELAKLSDTRPGDLDEVIYNIAPICDCLGLNLDEVLLWRPSLRGIGLLARCLAIGTASDMADAILRSIDEFSEPIVPQKRDRDVPVDFLAARRLLHQVLTQPSTVGRRRRRWKEHEYAVEKTFVEPLLAMANDEPDLNERTRLAAVAQLNGLLHSSLPVFKANLVREITQNGLRNVGNVLESRNLAKLFDSLGRLSKKAKK